MAHLNLINVSKNYSSKVAALKNFNLQITSGEFVAVVGPSGCGKSTLLRVIAGLEEVTSGIIKLNGKEIQELPPNKRNIAMMFQNYVLFPHMTVYDNMAFGLKLRKTSKSKIKYRVEKVALTLGIHDLLYRLPHLLSGGQRQRAALGRAILRDPDIFLLDEPLSNLDAKMRTQMRAEISRLQKNLNATMIFVTHDQTEAMTMGNRIIVLKDGKIQQIDNPETLYKNPVNTFVAGFIGSPSMNFFIGIIENSQEELSFKNSCFTVKVPGSKRESLSKYTGKKVILGIRPENIGIINSDSQSSKLEDIEFNASIDFIENLGSHSYLHMKTGTTNLIVRADSGAGLSQNDCLNLQIDTENVHFFDKKTDLAI